MGFGGWGWWGTSRSQLAKTMPYPSFTANARRSDVTCRSTCRSRSQPWCLWTSSRRPLCLGPLCWRDLAETQTDSLAILTCRNPTVARRGPSCMALPRALASALAAVLDDCGFYTLDHLATYLESDESSAAFLAARIRSDECKALVRATLAQDAMSLARASAELRMLGSEIAAIEESDAADRMQAIRGTKAAADVLILEERVSKTTADLTIAQQAAERRNRALKSANMELSAVKAELAAAARAAVEADQEIKSLGLALLEAKAARSAAEAAQAAAMSAQAAAEATLADTLAAQTASPTRVEMVTASTNTIYLVDGVGLASTGTQTTLHVLPPDRHSPAAPPPPLPRSSSPPPHHLPPRPPSPLTPSMPQTHQPSDAPPPVFAPYPTDQSPVRPKLKITYRVSEDE